jgi:hypothetical protein
MDGVRHWIDAAVVVAHFSRPNCPLCHSPIAIPAMGRLGGVGLGRVQSGHAAASVCVALPSGGGSVLGELVAYPAFPPDTAMKAATATLPCSERPVEGWASGAQRIAGKVFVVVRAFRAEQMRRALVLDKIVAGCAQFP